MKLEQSFEVEAPIDAVWQALIDVERVAPCLPGASVTGRNEDGSYAGNLTIKIGPTTAAYAGRLEMDQIDESAHVATMQAQGTDKRGQGGAKATITSTLTESGQATRVDVSTDYHITGRLARFGRGGMIEDISNRLLREFASCLQKSLAGQDGAAAEPAAAGAEVGGDGAASAEVAETPAPTEAADAVSAEGAETPAPTEAADAVSAEGAESPAPTEAADAETTATAPSGEAPPPPSPERFGPPAQEAGASEPIEGIPLVASILWERTRRNPLPAALVLGFLLALVTLRRRRH
ncbi:MAG: SRPBCC domain-containing protein [Solirubrobacteraceae bacterium]